MKNTGGPPCMLLWGVPVHVGGGVATEAAATAAGKVVALLTQFLAL